MLANRRTILRMLVLLIALFIPSMAAHAQSTTAPQSAFPPEPPVSHPLLAGSALGVVGFFGGGLIGYATVKDHCDFGGDDFCGLGEFFLGAAVGGTVGLAAGVHLGNRRRGNFGTDLLVGAAIWGGGIGLVSATGWDDAVSTAILVGIPIAQLVATTSVERSVGRKAEKAHALRVALVPRPHGMGVVGSVAMPRIH